MTICNTGGLATVERGTALAVIQTLHEAGRLEEALVLETRPLLQGARLTAWELQRWARRTASSSTPQRPFLLARGAADVVVTGADRVAANGDTANKIGTFGLALGARHAGVPFVVVAPESTLDADDADRRRDRDRGPRRRGGRLAAAASRSRRRARRAANPAFDVTPCELITALVTERRVVRLADGERL